MSLRNIYIRRLIYFHALIYFEIEFMRVFILISNVEFLWWRNLFHKLTFNNVSAIGLSCMFPMYVHFTTTHLVYVRFLLYFLQHVSCIEYRLDMFPIYIWCMYIFTIAYRETRTAERVRVVYIFLEPCTAYRVLNSRSRYAVLPFLDVRDLKYRDLISESRIDRDAVFTRYTMLQYLIPVL